METALTQARLALFAEDGVAWATPVLFMRSPDGHLWQVAETRRQRRMVAWAGIVLLLLLGTGWGYWQLRPDPPLPDMPGIFNVAVADFGIMGANGQIESSQFGTRLTGVLLSQLQTELGALPAEIRQEIVLWPNRNDTNAPKALPVVMSHKQAEALAADLNATLLVYGYLKPNTDVNARHKYELVLEFYQRSITVANQFDTTLGQHQLGSPIATRFSIEQDSDAAQEEFRMAMSARAGVLSLVTRGLLFEVTGKPQAAFALYQQAESMVAAAGDDVGRETFYIFMGRAARMAGLFAEAVFALEKARSAGPDHAAPYLNLGLVHYDRAQLSMLRGQPIPAEVAQCYAAGIENSATSLDEAAVESVAAIALIEKAIALAPTSPWPPVESVARLALGLARRVQGQIALFRGEIDNADKAYGTAAAALQPLVDEFTTQNAPDYVGWTQAALGVIYLNQSDVAENQRVTALNADDASMAADRLQQRIEHLQAASTAFDACLAQADQAQNRAEFQRYVVECACLPLKEIVDTELGSLGGNP